MMYQFYSLLIREVLYNINVLVFGGIHIRWGQIMDDWEAILGDVNIRLILLIPDPCKILFVHFLRAGNESQGI